MNVFVIGGNGFIGSHVCRRFLSEGHHVTVFGPSMKVNLLEDIDQDVQRIEGDILDLQAIKQALQSTKAEVIIHLAAYGGTDGLAKGAQQAPKLALDVNIIGFHNVLESAREVGISRILWSGSTTVYGSAEQYQEERVNELSAMNPVGFYGATKVMDEFMSRYYRIEHGMDIIGIRLPLIYGPGRWYKGAGAAIVNLFEQAFSREEVVIQGVEDVIDWMYVKDVARVFVHASSTPRTLNEVYNVKSHTSTIREMVEIVKRQVPESNIRFQVVESPMVYPLICTRKMEEDLGFTPDYTVDRACKDYLDDIRRNRGD